MTDQYTAALEEPINDVLQLKTQFLSASEKNQLQLIPQFISAGEVGLEMLREFLSSQRFLPANLVVAKAYQALYQINTQENQEFLQNNFPGGVVVLQSERNIDYQPLQELLIKKDWQAADTITREKLCELAGVGATTRKWVYFTEVQKYPITDLQTLNQLWWIYSEGKFGFAVQRQIWLSVGKDFSKLWPVIGWKKQNIWTKYPQGFTWGLDAPAGHLPLLNQLRGAQVIISLYSHPVWQIKN